MAETTQTTDSDAAKPSGVEPRLIVAGVAVLVAVLFPLWAVVAVTVRYGLSRAGWFNAWTATFVTTALSVVAVVILGIPNPVEWVPAMWAEVGEADSVTSGVIAAWLLPGVWPVLLGALTGSVWVLWAQWGSVPSPFRARKARKVAARIAGSSGFVRDKNGSPAITLGVDRGDDTRPVTLPLASTNTGTLVLGATGAGKTRGVMTVVADAIAAGCPVVYIDLKGASDVPLDLAGLAALHGRPFWHFKLADVTAGPYVGPAVEGPAVYNPAGYGDATRRKDLLMGALGSDNAYFANMTARYVQTAFSVLLRSGALANTSALAALQHVLDPAALRSEARRIPTTDPERDRLLTQVDQEVKEANASRDAKSALGAMRTYLGGILDGVAGPFITDAGEVIDFREIDRVGGVAVFSLSDLQYRQLASTLGTLIIQDLSTYVGEREHDTGLKQTPFFLVVDEFSAFGRDNILSLLARGRSSNLHTVLATQNLADLARAGDGFRDQVLGIVGNFALFRGNTRADCEILSGLTGTATINLDPDSDEPDPEFADWVEFQRLQPGECIVVNNLARADGRRLERVNIVLRDIPEVAQHTVWPRGNAATTVEAAGAWLDHGGSDSWLDGEDDEVAADLLDQMLQPVVTEPDVPALRPARNVEAVSTPVDTPPTVQTAVAGAEEQFGGLDLDTYLTPAASPATAAPTTTPEAAQEASEAAESPAGVTGSVSPPKPSQAPTAPPPAAPQLGRNKGIRPPDAPPPSRRH